MHRLPGQPAVCTCLGGSNPNCERSALGAGGAADQSGLRAASDCRPQTARRATSRQPGRCRVLAGRSEIVRSDGVNGDRDKNHDDDPFNHSVSKDEVIADRLGITVGGVRRTRPHCGYAISAVLSAVAFLEALVNEVFQDAADTSTDASARIAPLGERLRRRSRPTLPGPPRTMELLEGIAVSRLVAWREGLGRATAVPAVHVAGPWPLAISSTRWRRMAGPAPGARASVMAAHRRRRRCSPRSPAT